MHTLKPFHKPPHSLLPTVPSSSRPSIHEVAASILNPQPICRRAPRTSPFLLHSLSISTSTSTTTNLKTKSNPKPKPRAHPLPISKYHTAPPHLSPASPRSTDRGPPSIESTQTDFSSLDVLGSSQAPSTAVNVCTEDGFHLSSGVHITGGAGAMLVGGEAFAWRPWRDGDGQSSGGKRLLNGKGQFEVSDRAWGVLGLVWPKPDLLIIGVGPTMLPLSPATRKYINSLGIRVEVQDTRNASAQFNLLATERGVGTVAAALVPIGWREGVGIVVEKE